MRHLGHVPWCPEARLAEVGNIGVVPMANVRRNLLSPQIMDLLCSILPRKREVHVSSIAAIVMHFLPCCPGCPAPNPFPPCLQASRACAYLHVEVFHEVIGVPLQWVPYILHLFEGQESPHASRVIHRQPPGCGFVGKQRFLSRQPNNTTQVCMRAADPQTKGKRQVKKGAESRRGGTRRTAV